MRKIVVGRPKIDELVDQVTSGVEIESIVPTENETTEENKD
jgi:hypothetical protein